MAIDITSMNPTQVVLRLATKNQEQLQKISMQISSGNRHEDFKGFAEEATTEGFISYKAELSKVSTYISSNNSAISRAKVADSSIDNLQNLANDLSTLITQRRNGASGQNIPVNVEAKGILDKIAGNLNVKFDGRFLFSGSKTNTQPVENIQTTNLLDNIPTDSYYRGDSEVAAVRSSDSEVTEYGVLANDVAFENLIGAAHMLMAGHAANDDDLLGQATDLLNTAISQLTTTRATTRIAVERMNKSNATHGDFKLLIQGNLDDVSQTNIVEATAIMSELTTIIQAGYMAFSRLSGLQLTNYLK